LKGRNEWSWPIMDLRPALTDVAFTSEWGTGVYPTDSGRLRLDLSRRRSSDGNLGAAFRAERILKGIVRERGLLPAAGRGGRSPRPFQRPFTRQGGLDGCSFARCGTELKAPSTYEVRAAVPVAAETPMLSALHPRRSGRPGSKCSQDAAADFVSESTRAISAPIYQAGRGENKPYLRLSPAGSAPTWIILGNEMD
jgi:hypothetical protein